MSVRGSGEVLKGGGSEVDVAKLSSGCISERCGVRGESGNERGVCL